MKVNMIGMFVCLNLLFFICSSFRINRRRRIMEPEVLEPSSEEENEEEEEEEEEEAKMETDETVNTNRVKMDIESSSDDEELNEEQIERRRQLLRQKAKEREEVLFSLKMKRNFN